MSPVTVYCVMGQAGSYEDEHEWPVIAYFDQKLAEQHKDLAQKRADVVYQAFKEQGQTGIDRVGGVVSRFDLSFKDCMDFSDGVHYYIMTICASTTGAPGNLEEIRMLHDLQGRRLERGLDPLPPLAPPTRREDIIDL